MPQIGHLQFSWTALRAAESAALGALAAAISIAVPGTITEQLHFHEFFALPQLDEPAHLQTANVLATLNGTTSGAAVVGCLIATMMARRYSCRRILEIACVISIVGGILGASSYWIVMLQVSRVVTGLGSGMLFVPVPSYLSETASPATRGAMSCVTGIMCALGYTIAAWIGFGCFYILTTSECPSAAWRFPLAFQCVIPAALLLCRKFIISSPRWLLSRGLQQNASENLRRLRASSNDPEYLNAKEEFEAMVREHEAESLIYRHRSFEMLRTRANVRRTLVSIFVPLCGQLLGIYYFANYSPLIYQWLGFEKWKGLLVYACWSTMTVAGNTLTGYMIDKVGRRKLMVIGTAGCLACDGTMAALSSQYQGSDEKVGLSMIVFLIWLFTAFWCTCMDATQFVYVAEIWPNHLRSRGTGCAMINFYLGSLVPLVVGPITMDSLGWKFFVVLATTASPLLPVVYFMCPETKGKTLEEIGLLFGDKDSPSTSLSVVDEEAKGRTSDTTSETVTANSLRESSMNGPENRPTMSPRTSTEVSTTQASTIS